MSCEDEGRDRGGTATAKEPQSPPATPGAWGEARFSLTATEGASPADTFTLDFQPPQQRGKEFLKAPDYGDVSWPPRELAQGLPKEAPPELRPEEEGPAQLGEGGSEAQGK